MFNRHEHQKKWHRTAQKLKEWGYYVNEETDSLEKCCGNCQSSRICEHIEGFYPEVFCEFLRTLNLNDMQIEFLGVCNRHRNGENIGY